MINVKVVNEMTISKAKTTIDAKTIHRSIRYRSLQHHYYRIDDCSILFEFGGGPLRGDNSEFWDRRRAMNIGDIGSTDNLAATFINDWGLQQCHELPHPTRVSNCGSR